MDKNSTQAELQQRVRELELETERLSRVEDKFTKSRNQARQYLNLPDVLFLSLDQKGNIASINDAGLDILGYRRDELAGENWFETCLPHRFRKDVLGFYRQLMSGEIEPADHYDNPVLRKDGSERVFAWNNTLLRNQDDEIVGTLSSGEDITARLAAERDLKEAYDIINRSQTVTVLWKNTEGWPVEFVSDNVVNLLGYSGAELVSGVVSYADLIHADDLKRVTSEVADNSSRKECDRFTHEPYRVVTKDDEIKWIDDQTSIRRNAEGEITHFQGIVLDITERKQAEEALLQEKNKLQEALAEIRTLSGMLPICAGCKKIRDDKGYWNQIECYIRDHAEVEFTHGICPECAEKALAEMDR